MRVLPCVGGDSVRVEVGDDPEVEIGRGESLERVSDGDSARLVAVDAADNEYGCARRVADFDRLDRSPLPGTAEQQRARGRRRRQQNCCEESDQRDGPYVRLDRSVPAARRRFAVSRSVWPARRRRVEVSTSTAPWPLPRARLAECAEALRAGIATATAVTPSSGSPGSERRSASGRLAGCVSGASFRPVCALAAATSPCSSRVRGAG